MTSMLVSSTVSCDSNLYQNGGNSRQVGAASAMGGTGAPGKTSFAYADHLGSPNVITDGNGAVIQRKKFLPFGAADEAADCGALTRDAKTGQCGDSSEDASFAGTREEDGGLLGLGNRFYDPTTGRFAQADPVQVEAGKMQAMRLAELDFQGGSPQPGLKTKDGVEAWGMRVFAPQDTNRYSYVLNNPLNAIDVAGYTGRAVAYWFNKYLENKRKGSVFERVIAAVLSTIAAIVAIIFAPEAAWAVIKSLIELGVTVVGATEVGFTIAYTALMAIAVGGSLYSVGSTWYSFAQGASASQLWQSAGIAVGLAVFSNLGRILDAVNESLESLSALLSSDTGLANGESLIPASANPADFGPQAAPDPLAIADAAKSNAARVELLTVKQASWDPVGYHSGLIIGTEDRAFLFDPGGNVGNSIGKYEKLVEQFTAYHEAHGRIVLRTVVDSTSASRAGMLHAISFQESIWSPVGRGGFAAYGIESNVMAGWCAYTVSYVIHGSDTFILAPASLQLDVQLFHSP